MLELGALAVSIVTLVTQRLDKRREEVRESADLQGALLWLSELLGQWEGAADRTDVAAQVAAFQDVPVDALAAVMAQSVAGDDVGRWLDERGTAGVASAQARLDVYAPELRERVEEAREARALLLAKLREALEAGGPPPEGLAEDLDETHAALGEAKRALDTFIRETFPAAG
jgi:hypothetical protein